MAHLSDSIFVGKYDGGEWSTLRVRQARCRANALAALILAHRR